MPQNSAYRYYITLSQPTKRKCNIKVVSRCPERIFLAFTYIYPRMTFQPLVEALSIHHCTVTITLDSRTGKHRAIEVGAVKLPAFA